MKSANTKQCHIEYPITNMMMLALFMLSIMMILYTTQSFANDGFLYTFKDDKSNHTVITSHPERIPKHYQLIKKQSLNQNQHLKQPLSIAKNNNIQPVASKYDKKINKLSNQYGIDPHLVKAIIHVESSFNAQAISPKGAQGLMQLIPATAKRFNVKDAFNPEQNIHGGLKYLQVLMKMFNGNLRFVLAAYNAGENNVKKYRGIPPFDETINYVEKVTALQQKYRRLQ